MHFVVAILISHGAPPIQNIYSTFALVKKTISICCFAIYFLATTQLSELLKLPMLVQHYIEHKHENNHLSLLGFLDIHYAHGSPRDADYDKDMKLPFKSVAHSNIAALSFFAPIIYFKQNPIVYCKDDKQPCSDYSFTYSSAYLAAIWQPPKSC